MNDEISEFIFECLKKIYEITLTSDEKCEREVSYEAMRMYRKYPCYHNVNITKISVGQGYSIEYTMPNELKFLEKK